MYQVDETQWGSAPVAMRQQQTVMRRKGEQVKRERPARYMRSRIAALLFCQALGACQPASRDSGASLGLVDFLPNEQMLFVGARDAGYVDVFHLPASAGQSGLEFVRRLEHPARTHLVRLVADRARGRLWVAAPGEVQVYAFRPGERARSPTSIAVPGEWISDLMLDANGNALVYTKGGIQIYRVDAESLVREKWIEPFPYLLNTALLSTTRNRAVLTRDHRHIIFQSPLYGTLAQIDVESRKVEHLEIKPPLDLTCGFLFWKYGSEAIETIDCDGRWSAELDFYPGARTVTRRFTTRAGTP
jgi:hypothetical protein